MQTFDSAIWGQIPQPEDFIELMSLILENKKGKGQNVSFWRGQAQVEWKLDSSIVRKALKTVPSLTSAKRLEDIISMGEEMMINKAKKNLLDYDERGRKLSDIELLARLQHFGAATRLVDFSKNVLNALWFCVSDRDLTNDVGILLGIDTDVIAGVGENFFDFKQDYSTFCKALERLNHNGKTDVLMVDAPVTTQRISAQHSVFLCSVCKNSIHGFFQLPEEDKYLKIIAISPTLKKSALDIISSHFDITPYTIFPDIEGFASANSSKWNFYEFDRW